MTADDLTALDPVDDRPRGPAPTLEQVAERAGVSRSTASRAINGGLRVSPAAQAAVDDAVAGLGFIPNRAARSLVTRRTDSVALIVPEPDERVLTDPFFAGTINGLNSALRDSDLQLILVMARPKDISTRTLRYLSGGHVDGAVVVSHHRDDVLADQLHRSAVPTVFVGRPFEGNLHVRYVDVNNRGGGRIAAEHLVRTGRRRIATITGPQDMSAGLDRLAGWTDALSDAGLPTDMVANGDFTTAGGALAASQLLAEHPDLDGIFVASDLMAVGALRVLAAAGRSVPGDVAVVGYDNLAVAMSTTPTLTTIVNPVVAMARVAGEILLDLLAGKPVAEAPVIFAPELVIRYSA
ncbi:LacI family DNA-binding transcriptional regulator [Pengzhenrongella sicca]|uniref:LacI family DNA-binding transcriptional regulator n=1 Tax=Pengzhenrongella sicca TaxID=2819238 RepID=A0A8A4ZKU9_9MICO|nr:LacI family DNA-binding transcriptional regulator [Pengzhenrongella sicca]QTE30208.1 LacI family DNA-binding transcriptional regulator [Pengzhenrongella sicca]